MKNTNAPRDYNQRQNEPHFNTYYQPVGKPQKKKVNDFLRLFIFLIIIIILFLGLMFFLSSRANVDDLQSIEKKSNFVSAQHMPEICSRCIYFYGR